MSTCSLDREGQWTKSGVSRWLAPSGYTNPSRALARIIDAAVVNTAVL